MGHLCKYKTNMTYKGKLGSISPTFLGTAFTRADPNSIKSQSSHPCFLALLGSSCLKVACKTLMKLSPSHNPWHNLLHCQSLEYNLPMKICQTIYLECDLRSLKKVCKKMKELWVSAECCSQGGKRGLSCS